MRTTDLYRVLSLAAVLLVGVPSFTELIAAENIPAEKATPVISSAEIPAALHELIIQAITERRVVTFTYRGHLRVVEPHAYGRNAKGDAVLHAFQVKGSSASRPPPGWRTFAVNAIEAPKVGMGSFAQARDGYSPNELRLSPLWAELPTLVVVE